MATIDIEVDVVCVDYYPDNEPDVWVRPHIPRSDVFLSEPHDRVVDTYTAEWVDYGEDRGYLPPFDTEAVEDAMLVAPIDGGIRSEVTRGIATIEYERIREYPEHRIIHGRCIDLRPLPEES